MVETSRIVASLSPGSDEIFHISHQYFVRVDGADEPVSDSLGAVNVNNGRFCPSNLITKTDRLSKFDGAQYETDTLYVLGQALHTVANASELL